MSLRNIVVKNKMGDEYYTTEELYVHRYALFGALCKLMGGWKSKKQTDNQQFDGWFIAGIKLKSGMITYHLPNELYDEFPAVELEVAPEWDGHTSFDVIDRLKDEW